MAQQLLPFRPNTRRRYAPVRTVSFTPGSPVEQVEIPKTGLLCAIVLNVSFGYTASSAATTDFGIWNILKRIKVTLNQGSDNIIDLSGYGAFLNMLTSGIGWRLDRAGIGDTTPDTDIYNFPLANGTYTTAKVQYIIPISLNMGSQFELGLLQLQATDLRARVVIDAANAITDIATGLASFTAGQIQVGYLYYEVPPPSIVAQPRAVLVRTLEESVALTGTGQNIYQLPRLGALLNLTHIVRPNNARSNAVDSMFMRFNTTDYIENRTRSEMKLLQRLNYGVEFPTGVFNWQFFQANEYPNSGDFRDAIDTEEITTTESGVVVTAGTTFGSANNFLDSVRKVIQVIEM